MKSRDSSFSLPAESELPKRKHAPSSSHAEDSPAQLGEGLSNSGSNIRKLIHRYKPPSPKSHYTATCIIISFLKESTLYNITMCIISFKSM